MHFRKLGKANAATRLNEFLSRHRDEWIDGWTLSQKIKTTCIGTVASELRQNGVNVECCGSIINGIRGYYYRLAQS